MAAGWPMNGEGFTEGEKRDGDREKEDDDGARVPKRGSATATGGAPDLYVWAPDYSYSLQQCER